MPADKQRDRAAGQEPDGAEPARASFAHSERRRKGSLLTRIPHAERLLTWWETLKTSFWFVPSVMSLGAFALIGLAQVYDGALAGRSREAWPWFVYVSTDENAREILSTILSSMITMASLVFSITMVVLSLAANQFGPRLIRSFMASPQTQIVLGTFVMTIVYCLIALASIGTRAQTGQLPYSSVSIAVALTLVSVALLVLFLHSLARSIVSETVIERVAAELDALLDELTPLRADGLRQQTAPPADLEQAAAFVGPGSHGYVQAAEFDEIFRAACEHDVLVVLQFQAGDYLGENSRAVAVIPADRATEDLAQRLRGSLVTGRLRTPVQDPEAVIQQLVEIAVRALSPGINDPFTAIAVIDRLSVSIAALFTRELPTGVYRDRQGRPRLLGRMPTHRELLGIAFDQIRLNGGDKPVILRHLVEAVWRIAARTGEPDLLSDLADMAQSLADTSGRIRDPAEYREIAARIGKLRQHLAERVGASRVAGSPSREAEER